MVVLFHDIKFHNVVELSVQDGLPGYIIHRFPAEVRSAVTSEIAELCRSVELRFRTVKNAESVREPEITLYFMARNVAGEAAVFFGDYLQGDVIPLPCGIVTPVKVRYNPALDSMPRGRFANRLCRVFLNARASVSYLGVEGIVSPPEPSDEPEKTLVCYGSSITHGGIARSNYNAYIQQAARRLGTDVLNLGMSGACLAEPAITSWLVQQDAAIFVIELGANMLCSVTPEEFERRAREMLYTLAAARPQSAVIAPTMFPRGGMDECAASSFHAFNASLRTLCAQAACSNLHLLEGDALLYDQTGLTSDLIHPSDYGHTMIGERLATALRPYL